MDRLSRFAGTRRRPLIILSVILVAAIVVVIIVLTQAKPDTGAVQEGSTVRLGRMDIEQTVSTTGTARSIDSRSLTSSQTGEIVSVNVTEGQSVKTGEILCIFDTSLIDLNIASTQNSLATAQAQYDEGLAQAEGMVSSAYNQYDYDKTRLDSEVQKAWDALEAEKTATPPAGTMPPVADPIPALQAAYDQAVSTRDATLRADGSAITTAENALANQRLMDTTSTIQSQLDTYQRQKEEATLTSPIDGTVTTVNAKVNGYAGMEGSLFIIEDITTLEVVASVPEYDAVLLTTGLSAHIISDALQNTQWDGVIKSISPVATDTSSNFTVTISLSSPLSGLKSGMSTKVNIVCDNRKNVFAVPYGALVEKENGDTVIYAIDEEASSASEKIWGEIVVTTGLESDYYIEIASPLLAVGLTVDIDPERLNINTPSDSIMDMF
jgi:RND family efflux transporter MFP subunit